VLHFNGIPDPLRPFLMERALKLLEKQSGREIFSELILSTDSIPELGTEGRRFSKLPSQANPLTREVCAR
jgi:hypothetical protein